MNVKNFSALILALTVFPILGLGSCTARFKDISHDPEYAEIVGQQCVVVKGLKAHGFTLDSRKKDTYGVDVTTLPGIGGPEITFKIPIPKGTSFIVTSVRECLNCPFNKVSYGIQIPEMAGLASQDVFARAEALAPEEVQCRQVE